MENSRIKPILKWAGGKSQLLDELVSRVPLKFERYVEPFFGGGALFFALRPQNALIADSNPELVNLYKNVAENPDGILGEISQWQNTEAEFYRLREWEWFDLPPTKAAARTIFLNKTCFNGLYRVNRKGKFNVPFGYYKNPRILDEKNLRAASLALRNAEIICSDFRSILSRVSGDDFVFLDPPYIPVSVFADFKRYTKVQFSEIDHRELAAEVVRLKGIGCNVVVTNSDAPLVHEIYSDFERRTIQTKRHISCNGNGRIGYDVVIS